MCKYFTSKHLNGHSQIVHLLCTWGQSTAVGHYSSEQKRLALFLELPEFSKNYFLSVLVRRFQLFLTVFMFMSYFCIYSITITGLLVKFVDFCGHQSHWYRMNLLSRISPSCQDIGAEFWYGIASKDCSPSLNKCETHPAVFINLMSQKVLTLCISLFNGCQINWFWLIIRQISVDLWEALVSNFPCVYSFSFC